MKTLFKLLAISFQFVICSSSMLAQSNETNTKSFKVFLDRLYCKKTTDPRDADEVYIIIQGKRSDGQSYFQREPGTSDHWDMNDDPKLGDDKSDGDSYSITNKFLFTGELKDGQFWDLNFTVMEEDGFNSIAYQDKAAVMLERTGNPYAEGAAVIIKVLTELGISIKNTDDWMGMFGLHISNNNGKLSYVWKKKEGIADFRNAGDKLYPEKMIIKMNHDGSIYDGYFHCESDEDVDVYIKNVGNNCYLSYSAPGLGLELVCVNPSNSFSRFKMIKDKVNSNVCHLVGDGVHYITRDDRGGLYLDKHVTPPSKWLLEEVAGEPGVFRIKDIESSTYIVLEPEGIRYRTCTDFYRQCMWTFEIAR